MKLHIDHSNTKRTIDGDFQICGSERDLRRLADQIIKAIGSADYPTCTYGWVEIREPLESRPNSPPVGWDS